MREKHAIKLKMMGEKHQIEMQILKLKNKILLLQKQKAKDKRIRL